MRVVNPSNVADAADLSRPIPCTWRLCPASADVSVDHWLFLGPIDYCRRHSEEFMAELRRMGATIPFIVGKPRGLSGYEDDSRGAAMLRMAS